MNTSWEYSAKNINTRLEEDIQSINHPNATIKTPGHVYTCFTSINFDIYVDIYVFLEFDMPPKSAKGRCTGNPAEDNSGTKIDTPTNASPKSEADPSPPPSSPEIRYF